VFSALKFYCECLVISLVIRVIPTYLRMLYYIGFQSCIINLSIPLHKAPRQDGVHWIAYPSIKPLNVTLLSFHITMFMIFCFTGRNEGMTFKQEPCYILPGQVYTDGRKFRSVSECIWPASSSSNWRY